MTAIYTAYVAIAARFVEPDRRTSFRARHQRNGCRILCRIFGLRVEPPSVVSHHGNVLLISNHFGILDPFVLASVLPVAFAGKAEIAGWPFFGWVARTFGVIFVHRDRKHAVAGFLEQVRVRMRSGVPVLVFPEGTTSADEEVLPFKTGAFAAVVGMNDASVLPVYLRPVRVNREAATGERRRQVTWAGGNEPFLSNLLRIVRLRSIEMEVTVGQPLDVTGRSRKELAELSRARLIALRDRERAEDIFVR